MNTLHYYYFIFLNKTNKLTFFWKINFYNKYSFKYLKMLKKFV